MRAPAYYNENNPAAVRVLRALMREGVIAPGVVDDRSIADVSPGDLRGFAQIHLFAGGGLWNVAARMAGWPDERPLWTASCPCQPFSASGQRAGIRDPRHLWPHVDRLVRALRPAVLVGEQVAGAAGYGWLDGVRADLAAQDYACRGVDIPACAMDAPQIRQRLYWVALAGARRHGRAQGGGVDPDAQGQGRAPELGRALASSNDRTSGLVDSPGERRREGGAPAVIHQGGRATAPGPDVRAAGPLARPHGRGRHGGASVALGRAVERAAAERDHESGLAGPQRGGLERRHPEGRGPSAVDASSRGNGPDDREPARSYWAGAEWIVCHDGKARRTQPGLRLLAHGIPGRVDLWSIAGNGIVPEIAAQVIASVREALEAGELS